jgi:hypothetical protein
MAPRIANHTREGTVNHWRELGVEELSTESMIETVGGRFYLWLPEVIMASLLANVLN